MRSLLLSVLLLVCACDKDQAPATLESIVSNNFWKEDIRFVYSENGVTNVTKDIMYEFGESAYLGSHPYMDEVLFQNFYLEPETHCLRRYLHCKILYGYTEVIQNVYYRNCYYVFFDQARQMISITSSEPELCEKNAVVGIDLKVLSASEEQIVLEGPIKPFIYKHWNLEEHFNGDYRPKREYKAIRVTWTRIEQTPEMMTAEPSDYPPITPRP